MLSYCLKCRKNTENKNTKVLYTKNGRIIVCNSKKVRFIKELGLLSSLGMKKSLSKILLVGLLLF